MQELEYKFLISNEEFNKFINAVAEKFGHVSSNLQINYYYDTDDFEMLNQKTTVRVRQKENNLVLQTKVHEKSELSLNQSVETKSKIDVLPKTIILSNMPELTLKGNLVTKRQSFIPYEGISIDFDINYYLGVCDYEIEVEFLEEYIHKADEILTYLNLNNAKPVKHKSERFFDKLLEMESENLNV